MSAATTDDMIAMIPELAIISSGTVVLYLDDAALQIHDVEEDHASYNMLHRYMTAHLLAVNNIIKGEVESERVADVAVSYSVPQKSENYSDKWERKYFDVLANILGIDYRFS
jgi:hypothetical protein